MGALRIYSSYYSTQIPNIGILFLYSTIVSVGDIEDNRNTQSDFYHRTRRTDNWGRHACYDAGYPCPGSGYEQTPDRSACLKFFPQTLEWGLAHHWCYYKHNANLATIMTEEVDMFITCEARPGSATFFKWKNGEPKPGRGCVKKTAEFDRSWAAEDCFANKYSFFCQTLDDGEYVEVESRCLLQSQALMSMHVTPDLWYQELSCCWYRVDGFTRCSKSVPLQPIFLQTSSPNRMSKPYLQTLSPSRMSKPYLQTLSPNRMSKPYLQTLSPSRMSKPYLQTLSPSRMSKPYLQTLTLNRTSESHLQILPPNRISKPNLQTSPTTRTFELYL
ncbi:hypothetical protein EGW08_004919 [Elysia chlorotica]|uniref:C-type lectin domain-containing protein n=1 Tax=Elysia chlorotica TaxID=188477 RepID=A0A3S1CAD0_ELYCH|nr:hypothetical protein EGW08_004919 [Elysia chlorotica]